jgi:zinc protease
MKLINIKKWMTGLVLVYALPVMAQTDAYDMMVNGVKVIVQPSHNDIVQIQAVIKGGVQNYGFDKQGIESLAINALTECGTQNDDKNAFKDKLDKVSAQMYGSSGKDFSSFSLNCIKSDLNDVWPLFADALTKPKFDEKEFARIKQDAINNIKGNASQPDYAINEMLTKLAYGKKDFAKNPDGTEEAVTKLTAAETKAYYSSIFTKSRLLFVVVADLDRAEIEQKIGALLANIPQGAPFSLKKESYMPAANSFKAEKKDVATNYIQGKTSGPTPGSPDYNAYVLAMRLFSQHHFLEVRTNNGLSYAPGSWFDGSSTASGNISVSTTNPNKYIEVVKNMVGKLKQEGFNNEELSDAKTGYLTSFYYRQETNSAQANFIASNEVIHNNWKRALTIYSDMKQVSVEDVNRAFGKYFSNITWAYQGNPAQANPALFTNAKPNTQNLPKPKVTVKKKG